MLYETLEGEILELDLNQDESLLWHRANYLYSLDAPWEQIGNLVTSPESPIWHEGCRPSGKRLEGRQVLELPLFLAIQDLHLRAGVAQGHITAGPARLASRPRFDHLLVGPPVEGEQ